MAVAKKKTKVAERKGPHVRWMILRDRDEVMRIECEEFVFPWSVKDFELAMGKRNCIGMVAEDTGDDAVCGYMVYNLHKTRIELINFAVDGWKQRQGIGRALMAKLIGKLSPERRTRITVNVRESNVDAQLFFQAMGFRCVATLCGYWDKNDSDEDAYVFEYVL